LIVANLSRFVQFVELDLAKYKTMLPFELSGHTPFPPIGELPYLLTLGGHSFYWFSLEAVETSDQARRASLFEPPVVVCTGLSALCSGEEQALLTEILSNSLLTRRWFRGRHRKLASIRITDAVPV